MLCKYDLFKIGILLLAFNKWKTCDGSIKFCKDELDLNFYLPEIGSSKNISICVVFTQTFKDLSDVTVQLFHSGVYYKSGGHVHFYLDQLVNRTFYFNFNLKINSSDDYGVWNVKISSSQQSSLEFKILILQQVTSELNFTFKENKQDNEMEFLLLCEGTNYPKHIEIRDLNERTISKNVNSLENYKKNLHIETHIQNDEQCSSFGSYVCSMTDYKNKNSTKTLDLFDHHCDPKLCVGKSSDLFTNEKSTVIHKVCVVHNYSKVNVTIYDLISGTEVNDPRWSHVYKPRTKFVGDVELTLRNAKEEDFKKYMVVLIFTQEKNLTHYFNIKLKDHPTRPTKAIWMPQDFCNKLSPRPFFRTVTSGLQLSPGNITNNETHISIIHKYGSSEYYIKIMFTNCTQYINKSYEVNIQAGAGTYIPISLDIKEQPVINVCLCNVSTDGSEYIVQLGQSFQIEICVNTSHILQRDNIGLNSVPMTNLTNVTKYHLHFNRTSNQNIVLGINNITNDDIRMYVVKIKTNIFHELDFSFFLRLTEGVPVFCNGTRPQTTYNVIFGKTITIKLCLRSYPELSKDVVINGKMYNRTSNRDQLIVQSKFDETSLTYNVELIIQNVTYENVGFLNVTFKTVSDQELQIPFILNVMRDLFRIESFTINGSPNKTLATEMSNAVLRCTVTRHYNSTISIRKEANTIYEERTDQAMHSIVNITCLDTGMYQCRANHIESSEVNSNNTYLAIQSCPPRLCANETMTRNITVSRDQNVVVVTFCLIARGTINSSVLFNGKEIRHGDCSVCYNLNKNNDSFVDYTLWLRFNNLTTDDVGKYILKLWDASNQSLAMNISLQFQNETSLNTLRSDNSHAGVILVSVVLLLCLTCITVGAVLFSRRRHAKQYKVVKDRSYYANISDAQREMMTDNGNESNGYTPHHDVILPERDKKFHLPFSKSSFKKKGNLSSKSVHFGSASEGHWTDQSTDVTSIGSTIRLGSEDSTYFSDRLVVSTEQSNHFRSSIVSTEGENWGRYVSKEGLIYLELSNSDISSNKSKASSKISQASGSHEKVEYAQLDFNLMKRRAKGKSKMRREDKPKAHQSVNQNVSV